MCANFESLNCTPSKSFLDMFSKVLFSDQDWTLPPRKVDLPTKLVPSFDLPHNPVPYYVSSLSGDKVQSLETTEKSVQLLLRKKHLYLTRVKHTYKLRKLIFHTQVYCNWNVSKGYPENRSLRNNPPVKTSTILPGREAVVPNPEPVLPSVVLPHSTIPKTWPRNFFRGVPRPIRYPAFHPEETDCSGEIPIPEYIIVPFPLAASPQPEATRETDPGTEFYQVSPPTLIRYSSYFDNLKPEHSL